MLQIESISDGATVHFKKKKRVMVKQEAHCTAERHDDTLAVVKQEDDALAAVVKLESLGAVRHDNILAEVIKQEKDGLYAAGMLNALHRCSSSVPHET